eukprot:CAMPEP_0172157822 /NCGR_PEP_ID=MMETSP1050-20130122/4013_1 /TAXON_ID=233186 /ORGANISM="Cryptomonas curvata, Strain CCAP979/52" /LENGTH=46 /DNA_ID= /DNA_START= /DNA_END= /DNA_ORIENTATION=
MAAREPAGAGRLRAVRQQQKGWNGSVEEIEVQAAASTQKAAATGGG